MKYWDEITAINDAQEKKGIETYGQTLEDNHSLTSVERKRMTQEELVDALKYMQHDIHETNRFKTEILNRLVIIGVAVDEIMDMLKEL